MNNGNRPKPLPVDVREALEAICVYGKGRCWYCDAKLPKARKAIREGWDVQRVLDQPVASIILVCPACLRGDERVQVTGYRLQQERAAKSGAPRQQLRPLGVL